LLIAIAAVLLAAAFVFAFGARFRMGAGWIVAAVPAALFAAFLIMGWGLTANEAVTDSYAWVPTLGIQAAFRLDGFSLLFALLITGIGTLVVIFTGGYFAGHPDKCARFLTLILAFMAAMLGTVLSDNLIVMFVFWEATSLISFMLIGFHSLRVEARKAALQSLIVTASGGLALFAGILLIGIELGTFSLSEAASRSAEIAASPYALAIMVLVLLGAFTKSAQFPFHFWLPAAMEAPAPASAFLHSATMVKLGVYLLARFDLVFADMPVFGSTLIFFGSLTMLVAAIRALASDGYKAVLAQSTVASLGVLVMLIGLDGTYAATATIAFILAHAFYKAALFFCAGTTIHATEEGNLSRLGGLASQLPMTATAASLAALSMAGLPPTLGFITKEYLFESQLNSSSTWLVVAIAVLVNAVFVAIAGMAALRPFFSRQVVSHIHHGESLSLWIGPVLLGVLGLLFGLAPWLLIDTLLAPATSALLGHTNEVSFSLWHGFTPMLALSATVVALGAGVLIFWQRIQTRLIRAPWIETYLGSGGFKWVFDGTLGIAERSTRILQNGDQHRYTTVVLASVVAITVFGILMSGTRPEIDVLAGRFDLPSVVVLGLIAAGALVATRTFSLLRAMISMGAVGFGSALIFLMNGAPDLALTQFSVEVLIVVIFAALLLRIPDYKLSTREPREKRWDLAISGAVGTILFLALSALTVRPLDLRLSDYFAQTSYTEAHGRNVVNVIIVDYRAIDTLGEIAVVAFAAIAVWGLLRPYRRRENDR
jgi:multicomponent Na+:H+ antiporter subunit A